MVTNSSTVLSSRLSLALVILRVSLGLFLLLWALEKFILPESTAAIWETFYQIPIAGSLITIVALLQTVLAIALIVGFWRPVTYGIALGIHGVSVVSTWRQLLDPWGLASGEPVNHLFLAGVPVLAAFVALYLLYPWDCWSVDGQWMARANRTPRRP